MKKLLKNFLKIICFLFVLIFFLGLILENTRTFPSQVSFGVTFSPRYARYLKLDWQKTYLQVLDELKVRNLRLPTYWNSPFSDIDFMLTQAGKRGVRVILVLGIRQPRWPECHIPNWARKLTVAQRQEVVLDYVAEVIQRYKDNQSIWAWQVENEPFLDFFGSECDKYDKTFFEKELALVRNLDQRPILLTDSGELGDWVIPMKLSDVLGISIYRTTYNSILGYQTYPLAPYLYNLKSSLIKSISGKQNQKIIVTELQAEPWLSDKDASASIQRQHELFPEANLKKNVDFASKTGFDEVYLWGVEWWYSMASQGYPQYLDYAKSLFN